MGLPRRWSVGFRAAKAAPLVSSLRGSVHMLIGSRDPIALDQMAELRAQGREVRVTLTPNGQVPAEMVRGTRALQVGDAEPPLPSAEATNGLVSGFASHALHRCGTLVVTGGEAASALPGRLGVDLLRVTGEKFNPDCRWHL